jgi:hypothetical protein
MYNCTDHAEAMHTVIHQQGTLDLNWLLPGQHRSVACRHTHLVVQGEVLAGRQDILT